MIETKLVERSVYPIRRRVRRAALRRLGRWPRGNYDVRVVYDAGTPRFKKIVFNGVTEARRVAGVLASFGESAHAPRLRAHSGNAVWVDYVDGRLFQPDAADAIARAGDCFLAFAQRHAIPISLAESGYRQQLTASLAWLRSASVIDATLAHALQARLAAFADDMTVRHGFDYIDPIVPNLLIRHDTGTVCAIDVKNIARDGLVGVGLAKAHARWLADTELDRILDRFTEQGMPDIASAYDFIRFYERIARVTDQASREIDNRGGLRKRADKIAKLGSLI
ncbi:hypothetical protein [Salinisphaera sp. Q1T1-3]|uniref:hypothetical protein n=1 Tax=Salinisphaera sp. Q1T1-3 TaxID=2321229 RepID=UPI000E728DE7|nr:hypothetical protein [Salinisphaera sp. Q1T1-3]RJS91208.1 hypothetical protein D3260_16275 [Salinisphaera sp. Q1T1-3]